MINLGKEIKKFRQDRGLTQEKLAEKVEIEATYLSAIENGRKDPSLPLLREIAKSLDLPMEILFWESLEIQSNMKPRDREIIKIAKELVRHYHRCT